MVNKTNNQPQYIRKEERINQYYNEMKTASFKTQNGKDFEKLLKYL